MTLKILVATLTRGKPTLLESVFVDGTLVMANPVEYAASHATLITELLPRLIKRRLSGYKVLVDEESGTFSKLSGARRVKLSDKLPDGRPVLSAALDRYNEMYKLKTIITPKSGTGFDIPTSLVDVSSNAQGETTYNIAWGDIQPSHVLTILSVFATFHNSPGSADYIAALSDALQTPAEQAINPEWLMRYANSLEKPETSLCGTKADNGARFL